jgi:DNA-binding NtrC family response regulator
MPLHRLPVSRGAEKSLPETNFDDGGHLAPVTVMHAFYETASPPPRSMVSPGEDHGTPLSVLVVEPALDELLIVTSMLSSAGFHVTAAASFAQARALLGGPRSFALLFTAVRLGMFNGLHLVVRARCVQPTMAALVTASPEDAMLQSEAESLGATFVVKPTTTQECIAAILQTVFRSETSAAPIRPPFERRRGERREARHPVSEDRRQTDRRRTIGWLTTPIAE